MEITKHDQVWKIWINAKDKLQAYVLSRFKDKALAEEVTQEVLLKLHKSCCSGKEINNLNAWLYQIAHNVSLDIIKRETKQRDVVALETDQKEGATWEELASFLEPLIDLLPEKYATPLRMSDIEEIPQKEIAAQLDLGLSATKSRIQRGRGLLKEEIKTCFHLETDKNGRPIYVELKDTCEPLKDK